MNRKWLRIALGVALLLPPLLAGCGIDHIRTLREAEQTFSRAAEQENQIRHSPAEAMKVPADSTGYRVAAEMAGKLIREKRAELEQDRLLCTAYVIRAFSLWRLGEFAQAVDASRQPCGDAKATPRDHALLKVVEALVGIDESNARMSNATRNAAEQKTTTEQLAKAAKTLADADAALPRDHPLRAYLFNARFAALRVAQDSPSNENVDDATERKLRQAAVAEAVETLAAYRKYLRCQLGLTEIPEHASVAHWAKLFGVDIPTDAVGCDK